MFIRVLWEEEKPVALERRPFSAVILTNIAVDDNPNTQKRVCEEHVVLFSSHGLTRRRKDDSDFAWV